MEHKSEGWVDAVGVLIVVFILVTIALVAAGGWTWYANFLVGSAASWVQAIGSIAAILAAGKFVQNQILANQLALQESKTIAEEAETDRRRRRKRELIVATMDIAEQIQFILEKIPVTAEQSNKRAWYMVRCESERLRANLDRIQGTEALGMTLLKYVNLVSFNLHVVYRMASEAEAESDPLPMKELARNHFVAAIKVVWHQCLRQLSRISTAAEMKADMEEAEEIKKTRGQMIAGENARSVAPV